MSIWRRASLIEPIPESSQITLGEGDTPLIPSRRIGPTAGLAHLLFKLENTNPAGSFEDRFGAAAISHMLARGATRCMATSSGNTGSALAAYCAAGMSGVQSIGYELATQSDRPIDHIFCPAGGGGLCVAIARGFTQLVQQGRLARCPAVELVQPGGTTPSPGRFAMARSKPSRSIARPGSAACKWPVLSTVIWRLDSAAGRGGRDTW